MKLKELKKSEPHQSDSGEGGEQNFLCLGHSSLWQSIEQYCSSRHRPHRLTGVKFPQTAQPGFKEVLHSMDEDGSAGVAGTVVGELIAKSIFGRVSPE